jgi:hypothetical protein
MKTKEYERVLKVLSEQDVNGIGLIALSEKTKIDYSSLHAFLEEHKECFVKIAGKPNYRINPFVPYHGNIDQLHKALLEERRLEENKFYVWIIVVVSVCISLRSTLMAMTNCA